MHQKLLQVGRSTFNLHRRCWLRRLWAKWPMTKDPRVPALCYFCCRGRTLPFAPETLILQHIELRTLCLKAEQYRVPLGLPDKNYGLPEYNVGSRRAARTRRKVRSLAHKECGAATELGGPSWLMLPFIKQWMYLAIQPGSYEVISAVGSPRFGLLPWKTLCQEKLSGSKRQSR